MKRHFNLLASVLLVIAMVFTLASCGLIDKFIPGNNQPDPQPDPQPEHQHAFVDGKCECGEADPNYVAPHEHNFVEGKCECGETDPNYTKPECTEHAYGAPEVTKEATCTESGERKLTCTVCGYSETKEIAPNGHEETKVPGKAPTCTAAGLSDGKVCSVCETVIVEQVEINSTGHSFVEGVCGNCGDVDPNYNGPKTYVLGVQTLAKISGKADGDTEVFGDFFTIYYSAKFKIDDSNKTFEDGFSGTQRLNWGGGTSIGSTTKNAIKFTVDGTATVKVWWVSGGTYDIKDGDTVIETLPRQIGIYDENGNLVTKSNVDDSNGTQGTDGIKNDPFLTELTISEAGTYYLGNVGNTNYFFEVAVTVTPAEGGSNTPALNGQGTTDEPFILPEAGDYVAAFPGGYDLVWYQYTPTANGYLTLSSNWEGSAWLKAGTDFNTASQNGGNGDVTIFVLAGTPVYLGVADWDEAEAKIPFTVSLEEVTLGSVDPFVGSWKGSLTSGWGGSTTYVVTINADGTGTIVADGGYYTATYNITLVVVAGDTVSFIASDDWGNSADLPVFTYDAENNKLVAASMDLVPYDPNEQPPVNPDVNYETVIVIGGNTLYFSAEEIAANAASRTANITVAGNYKFASGNLFVASVVDANGNTLTKNDDYSYTLAEGEYTVNFGMLSMFGVSADSACTLSVEEVVSGGDVGGGDDGDDGEGSYTEPYDSLKDSLYGFYTFEGFEVFFFYKGTEGIYYANVYGEGYDLYFTYDVTENDDGSYSITLTPVEHEANSGTEYIDTVLAFEIVIGGSTEECAHEYEQNMFYHPEMVPATCITPGVAVFECIYCDHYYTQPTDIDPDAHDFDYFNFEVISPATCTEDGVNKYTCSDCGATKESVSPASHDLEETIVYATCTTDGSYSAACKNCDYTESNVIPAEGHFSYFFSCGESGECLACGETFTKEHDVNPCEGGWCINCNNVVEGAHTWVDATCTAPKTCSVCKATDGEALGHNYVDGACVCGSKKVTVTAKSPANGSNMVEGTNHAKDFGLIASLFDVKATLGGQTTLVGLYAEIRMYGNESGNGNALNFTIKNGTIESVEISLVSGKSANCQISVGSNVVKTTTANDTTVTIEVNGNSFSLKNVNAGKDQVHISSIKITYVSPAHECEYSEATCIALATCSVCGLTKGEFADCIPGAAPTCDSTQNCTVCDKVLKDALVHNYGTDGKCTLCGASKNAEPVKIFTIVPTSFPGNSYASNNKTHTIDGYSFTSNQVMNQGSVIQWQKNNGYITADIAGLTKLEMAVTAGTFTVTVGGKTVTGTTSNGVTTYDLSGLTGQLKISVGGATGKTTSIVFYK